MKNVAKSSKLNIAFIVIFCLILVLPWIFMNRKEDQVSKIENKKLADWPGLSWTLDTNAEIEEYINDRIGFKEQAVGAYTTFNDKVFGIMVHPLFMWGENDNIYYKDPDYIAAYQRLNTDKDFIDSMVDFLSKTNDYLKEKDIDFLYYVCPDKKTIYPENFPKDINVNTENEAVLDYLDEVVGRTNIPYINPKEELLKAKEELVVYNKQYDATHWNEFGAFIGHTLIDEHIQNTFDDVKPLDINDYDIEMVNMDTLDNAKFTISEDVPLYSLKEDLSGDYTELLKPYMECETDTFYTHHINENVDNNRILLVFTDSYFQAHQKFYDNRFKEVYFVHRQNFEYVQYFVNLVFPDMVIFETAERSISSEIPLTEDFTGYYYEKPCEDGVYEEVTEAFSDNNATMATNNNSSSDYAYTVTNVKGARVDGNKIIMNPEDTTQIVRIEGVIFNDSGSDGSSDSLLNDVDVYVATADEVMEADYDKQYMESIEEGMKNFSINIQRRYMAQSYLDLFCVDETSGRPQLLERFEITYE